MTMNLDFHQCICSPHFPNLNNPCYHLIFNYSHSNYCVIKPHSCFKLHFTEKSMMLSNFLILIGHFFVFSSEMYIQINYHFYCLHKCSVLVNQSTNIV